MNPQADSTSMSIDLRDVYAVLQLRNNANGTLSVEVFAGTQGLDLDYAAWHRKLGTMLGSYLVQQAHKEEEKRRVKEDAQRAALPWWKRVFWDLRRATVKQLREDD